MANGEHLDILKQGVGEWNRWRQQNPGVRPDLTQADLSCMDLSEADFRMTELRGADLSRASLRAADFSQADLRDSCFAGSDLSKARFKGADLGHANLVEANLNSADFFEAKLQGTNLSQADFTWAKLWRTNLRGTDLGFALGLTKEQIETADGSADTRLPSGLQMPERWKWKPGAVPDDGANARPAGDSSQTEIIARQGMSWCPAFSPHQWPEVVA